MLCDVTVGLGDRSYPIYIGAGILDRLGTWCRRAGLGDRCLVVTDENVGEFYSLPVLRSLEEAGIRSSLVMLPPGEPTKSEGFLFDLYDRCLEAELDRRSFIVALGGGVVGDLAGFTAATFLRGIPYVQVPTSLLAMVDSSVGGKTGINLPRGKNLVGAFHQPRLVAADLETLCTLPEREYRAGLAEVVKYGIIRDEAFFRYLETHAVRMLDVCEKELLSKVIRRCCEIKAEVVSADEREGGLRAILNFGHTVGHAIEKVAGYGAYLHGEAVAVGMVYAARASMERCGLPRADAERIDLLLESLRLPVHAHGLSWKDLRAAIAVDKKNRGGRPRFVLASAIGRVEPGIELDEALMERIWNEM